MSDASTDDLSRLLANGLGGARVVLERGADESQRKALIAACLRDDAFPGEGSHAEWLYGLVRLVDASGELAAALADPFADSRGDDDTIQRFELIGRLARDGVPGMRESLYLGQERLVDQWLADPDEDGIGPVTTPAEHIIALDGFPGAAFAFGQLGRALLAGRPFRVDGDLVEAARSGMDAVQTDAQLAEARAHDPGVDAFLSAVEAPSASRTEPPPDGWRRFGWADLREAIERRVRAPSGFGPFYAVLWGEGAPEPELALAAQALVDVPKADTELLRGYLRVFERRAFPLDPAPLVARLDDPREGVWARTVVVLGQVSHPALRAAGLRMAEGGPHRPCALDLLASNWQPGDEAVVEGLLRAAGGRRVAIHRLCLGLKHVVDTRPPTPELVPALRLAYEVQPCSLCREDVVSALVSLGALSEDLRAECRWDANEGTRLLVTQGA